MKKSIIAFLFLGLSVILFIYVFIPKRMAVSHVVIVNATDKSAMKFLSSSSEWNKWFYGKKDMNGSLFIYQNQEYDPDTVYYNGIRINIKENNATYTSKIQLTPLKKDSLGISWECFLYAGLNPIKRILQYKNALQIKKNMVVILGHFETWVNKTENIYGLDIKHGKIQDSVLLSTKTIIDHYPSETEVYALLQKLQEHFVKFGAYRTGFPMLNVSLLDNGTYRTQVAIPINKTIPGTAEIAIKYMYMGDALTANVKGGNYSIIQGLNAMDKYRGDYALSSPAIAFQSLITDRLQEKDTAKWITKIYYPIY